MTPEQVEKLKTIQIFKPLNSAEELRNWMYLYLDIQFPSKVVCPESTHGPVECMWRIYELFKTGQTKDVPQVVMISSRDSYKCQRENTLLLTKEGFKFIQDVNIGDNIWSGFGWKKVTNWIDDGIKNSMEFELKNGLFVCGTPIHRYWALRDGKTQWIESQNIKNDDLVCINTNTGMRGVELTTNQEEYDNGYFLGLLAGDGSCSSITSLTHNHFSFTTIDERTKDWFVSYVYRKWNYNVVNGSEPITYSVWDKKAVSDIKDMGVKAHRSFEKEIPLYCYKTHSAMVGFIAGLFDTDGTYSSKNLIEIPITAGKLLKELQSVLIGYGINARLYTNKRLYSYEETGGCKQNHIVYKLYITGNEAHKFRDLGVELLAIKAGKLVKPQIHDAHDNIPLIHVQDFLDHCRSFKFIVRSRKYQKPKVSYRRCNGDKDFVSISHGKLKELFEWYIENLNNGFIDDKSEYFIDKISEIIKNRWFPVIKTIISEEHFYDVTVEDDHSYWSNGVISHNTLSAAAIEVLLFVHFKFPMAHAAAIKFQAGACVSYVNGFFRKLTPYLEAHGWKKTSDNKTLIEWKTGEGEEISLTILTASVAGMNSRHVPFMALDELDLMDGNAFKESRLVVSSYKGHAPLLLILSTRKYNFGLMEQQINLTPTIGGEVFRWNILDVTEHISKEEARADEPKITRYITSKLPMVNLSPKEYSILSDEEKNKYERFEAYAGIAEHKMLPIMKNMLVDRPEEDRGNLYKTVTAVHNNFKLTDIEIADAQLLCNKPSSAGLVYNRFVEPLNTITIDDALFKLTDEKNENMSMEYFRDFLVNLGVVFIGGGDFGFTDFTSLVVLALIPNGEVWVVDGFCEQSLELSDIVKYTKELQDRWGVDKWFMEQAYPAYLKTMRKQGIKCPEFTKVVADGLTAIKSKIVDISNVRKFFVVRQPNTIRIIDAFTMYNWQLDSKGDIIEGKPFHGTDGTSDIMDSIRYPMQNLFGKEGNKNSFSFSTEQTPRLNNFVTKTREEYANEANRNIMQNKINELTGGISTYRKPNGKKRIIF